MTVTREEEIVLLYALYVCGKRPSKGRATDFILGKNYFVEKQGDEDTVTTGESRIENRIAWIRENLKIKDQLDGSQRGIWAITAKGIERIESAAIKSLKWEEDMVKDLGIVWERFSVDFLADLNQLGRVLQDKQNGRTGQST